MKHSRACSGLEQCCFFCVAWLAYSLLILWSMCLFSVPRVVRKRQGHVSVIRRNTIARLVETEFVYTVVVP